MLLADLKNLQSERLVKLAQHVYQRCPVYQQKFNQAGAAPSDIKSIGTILSLPYDQDGYAGLLTASLFHVRARPCGNVSAARLATRRYRLYPRGYRRGQGRSWRGHFAVRGGAG